MRRQGKIEVAVLLAAGLIAGCASTPDADSTAGNATVSGSTEPKVVQTVAQAEKYVSKAEVKRAYRACMRKMRRITGSRIPRNSCPGSAGLYSGAYNQRQEGQDGAPGLP